MGDGEDDDFFPPDHVSNVVLTKAWREIDATGIAMADGVKQRVVDDQAQVSIKSRIECSGEWLILIIFIQESVMPNGCIELLAGGWMDVKVASYA